MKSGMLNHQQRDCNMYGAKANYLAMHTTLLVRCYSASHSQVYLTGSSLLRMASLPTLQKLSNSTVQRYRSSSAQPLQQMHRICGYINMHHHPREGTINILVTEKSVQLRILGKDTVRKSPAMTHWASFRHYSTGGETVEKKLLHLMDMWEVEKAVALLRESVEEGVLPHPNVVLNLQQQLANLGEVECLLDLHDFLREHNLITDDKFFHCLKEAYYNSGRISEGVAVLRLLYHRTRKFADVDIYFTLLTVMVLRHFPERMDLILSFVTDLKDAEVPVLWPEASLWKCYMMMEKWTEADNLLLNNEELRPLLPQQVTRVCQNVDKADFDRAAVLSQMLDLPFIRQKLQVFVAVLSQMLDLPFIRQKLQVLVAETLIAELCNEKQWPKLLKSLKRIKSAGLPLHTDKLTPALDDLKRNLTPQYDEQIRELRQWCDSLQAGDKQGQT